MDNVFQGTSYRTSRAMHDAIAEAWLCAGGNNGRSTMQDILAEFTDIELANDAAENWGFEGNAAFDVNELVEAFADLRRDFDQRFPASN